MRLRPVDRKGAGVEADVIEAALRNVAGDQVRCTVSARTGSVLLLYTQAEARRRILAAFAVPVPKGSAPLAANTALPGMAKDEAQPLAVHNPIPGKLLSIFFYPRIVQSLLAGLRAVPYIIKGLWAFLRGRLDLTVLDGAALVVCLLRRDFKSLGSIVFFFALGDFLAEWTKKKSRSSLEESLNIDITHVWIRLDGVEQEILFRDLKAGDTLVVRTGSVIPADGTVVDGEGLVNQAFMTGESMPVRRAAGSTVYAGTTLEAGELYIQATKVGSDTRIKSIIRCIEESELTKAAIQGKYERIADAIVPYNFLLSGLVFALTRDPVRAGSVLLVDYSCAIRLATPLAIFTGMREAAEHGVLIKGGKFMEALAHADAVVFDKTGTLTQAQPAVVDIVPFGDHTAKSILRLAACLEEHFAHPVGQAVVRAAEEQNLQHREEHTQIEFIVAHGIASRWKGQRVLIGSEHFVLEDEGIRLGTKEKETIDAQAKMGRSVLYLSIGEELAGVILIEDAIRPDAQDVIQALREDGIQRIIMLTGDGPFTAQAIASRSGITEFKARVTPEGKAEFINQLKKEGHTVLMVGDGINDSPALSAADVGVAMRGGADLAREVADMVLTRGELGDILWARQLSRNALGRVRGNFFSSLLWNSLFLTGGLLGILRPGLSALLHNASTAAIAVSSMRPLLPLPQNGTEDAVSDPQQGIQP